LTQDELSIKVSSVACRSDREKFLRAAVKAGLRMQKHQGEATAENTGPDTVASDGVAVLQRIKASLNRRKTSKQS
jgi:hypothetical protein